MFEKKKRFTDQELGLIESTFKNQEQLVISIRKFLLQGELTDAELAYVKAVLSPAVLSILRKTLCPTLDKGAPMGGTVDMFSGMDLNPVPIEHAILAIRSRKLAYK